MNEIPPDVIHDELGDAGWKSIEQMAEFLFSQRWTSGKPDGTWRDRLPHSGRVGSSIISRSELEILGISMPRFAYRLHFRNGGGFINCRRSKTLREQLSHLPEDWWSTRDSTLKSSERHPNILNEEVFSNKQQLMANDSFIADCLLEPPTRFPSKAFHLTSANLYREYGERRMGNMGVIPFVKTISFGGGLCAQACCFAATIIQIESAVAVYGLGEITALASDPSCKELLLAGLEEHEMVRYFSSVGLGAIVQFSNPNKNIICFNSERSLVYDQALRAYVSSGVPVILFVDRKRLEKPGDDTRSIYAQNFFKPNSSSTSVDRHAIIVVGCNRSENIGAPKTYLFQDPSAMPFMAATIDELSRVGIYDEINMPTTMRHPATLPVTHSKVKMQLLHCLHDNRISPGLIEVSRRFTKPSIATEHIQFILTESHRLPLIRILRNFSEEHRAAAITLLQNFDNILQAEAGWSGSHWLWLECGPDVIKVWDAERFLDIRDESMTISNYLRATIAVYNLQLKISFGNSKVTH